MKIKKTKSGKYQGQVYLGTVGGKSIIRTLTAPTKKELMYMAAMCEASATSQDTVGAAIEDYIASRAPVLSPATIRGYKSYAKGIKRDLPVLWDTRLGVMDERKLQKAINTLAGLHKPKTVRNWHGLINSALRENRIRLDECVLPQKVRTTINIPTESEAKLVFEAARGTELEIPILLAASGLRRSEICALTPEDFDGDVVHVSRGKVATPDKKWKMKTPKTYSSDRFVELPAGIADKIRERGYVTKMTPGALSCAHQRFLKKHGIPHFRLHDWRHFMVSQLHAAGCSDAYIQQHGGWSSDYTMKNVYRHVLRDEEMSQKATEALASLLPY